MGGFDNLFITTWGVLPTVVFAVVLFTLMWWGGRHKGDDDV